MSSSVSPSATLDLSRAAASHLGNPRSRRKWDASVPPPLRPLVRAYLLAYASTVAPKLFSLLVRHLSKLRRKDKGVQNEKQDESLLASLQRILRDGMHWQRFPAFCAALIGGSTLLEVSLVYSLVRGN